MDPQTQQLDPDALNLTKAIRQVESGGNFQARGKSGEFGAYQYTPGTWAQDSQKFLGRQVNLDQSTPQEQNEVAYKKIKSLKDSGYNVGQIASIWNSGSPDKYLQDFRGTNEKGVHYDVPAYAKSVATAYHTIKGGGSVGADPNNPSSVAAPQPVQSQQEKSSGEAPEGGYSVGGFLGNVAKSGVNIVGGLAQAALHPIETAKTLGKTALGAGELLIPGEQGEEKYAKSLGKFFKDRYGGIENIKNSFYNDPLGVLLDVSTVLGTGGAALKAGGFAEAANVASKASRLTDPLLAAGKLVSKGAGTAADIAGVVSGGQGAVRDIYAASRAGGEEAGLMRQALRGNASPEKVLKDVQGAVTDLVKAEGNAYRDALKGIKEADANLSKDVVSAVRDTFEGQLGEMGIVRDKKGLLDFRGSVLDEDRFAMRKVMQLDEKLKYVKENPTAVNLDNLKRFAADLYKPNEPLNAISQQVKNAARDALVKNVKGYEEMTARYHEYKDFLDEVHGAVGNPNKATAESALRKVRSIFRDSQRERLSTVKNLQERTGRSLTGQVAGMTMNPVIPGGLAKYVAEGLGAGAIFHPGAIPALLPGLVATSPRVIAEVANALGWTAEKLNAVLGALEKAGIPRQQAMQMIVQAQRASSAASSGGRTPVLQ